MWWSFVIHSLSSCFWWFAAAWPWTRRTSWEASWSLAPLTRWLDGSETDIAGKHKQDQTRPVGFRCNNNRNPRWAQSSHRQDDRDYGSHTVCAEVASIMESVASYWMIPRWPMPSWSTQRVRETTYQLQEVDFLALNPVTCGASVLHGGDRYGIMYDSSYCNMIFKKTNGRFSPQKIAIIDWVKMVAGHAGRFSSKGGDNSNTSSCATGEKDVKFIQLKWDSK